MANPKLSVGLYVPNLDMAWKYQTIGPVGLPDGWTADALATTDLLTTPRVHWVPTLLGAGATHPAANYHGTGRDLRIEAPAALTNAARVLTSPSGMPAQLMAAEPNTRYGVPAEAAGWWARVRARFFGTTAPTTAWTVSLVAYNALETVSSSLGALTLAGGDWDSTWRMLESASIFIPATGTSMDHVRLKIDVRSGPAAGSSVAIFDSFTIETLGPIDFAEQLTGANASLVAADHDTFYQLSKWPQHSGSSPGIPTSLELVTKMPSGDTFTYDPSGGAKKLRFDLPYRYLKAADEQKIVRLWLANKGYGASAGGIAYGVRRPLVITGAYPAVEHSVYVNFDGRAFPLDVDQAFESPTAAGALWRGNLQFSQV